MIIGTVIGKTTTSEFEFTADKDIRKFEYIQIMHRESGDVLCQIIELIRDSQKTIAKAIVIGYKDANGNLKPLRTPIDPGSEVIKASDDFIKDVIKIKNYDKGAYMGMLEGKKIKVSLDLKKLLTKHVCVLAKSGAGKSYAVGVLLEEIMEKNVPLLIIDPHGEYSEMKSANDNEQDLESMKKFDIKPMAYRKKITEYGDTKLNPNLHPLKLNEQLDKQELLHLLPNKLSSNQMAVLFSAMKNMDTLSLTELLMALEQEDNNAKWNVISVIEYVKKLDIFSLDPTSYNELVSPGRCSIINLKGIDPYLQEMIVYKLLKDIFEKRKKEQLPPLFVVVEEAHNYVPERSFGEKKSSSILRTIASEGRKFGMGLCVISQRPARIEKNVLSQCTTQIILKITNPNDLKAVSNSVEGITLETENEIKNLPIGSALITGLVDIPLLVNIRPRKSKHGGESVDILKQFDEDNFFDQLKEFDKKELLPIIRPKISAKDMIMMSDREVDKVLTYLIPSVMAKLKVGNSEINILVDLIRGDVIKDISESIVVNSCDYADCAIYEKVEYVEIPYSKKLKKKKNVDEVLSMVKEDIIEKKECYVVYHKLVYKDETK